MAVSLRYLSVRVPAVVTEPMIVHRTAIGNRGTPGNAESPIPWNQVGLSENQR